jgi:glycosyltransferase involved in cell wall biosynthesis
MTSQSLTVIIPNYNHAHYLKKLFKDIISQTCLPNEIIIIDDGSTDDSVCVIKEIIKCNQKLNIKFIELNKNEGVVYAVNLGANESTSQYIYFAAADDSIALNFFEDTLSVLEKFPQAGLCSSIVTSIDLNDIRVQMQKPMTKISSIGQYFNSNTCKNLLLKQDSWMGGNSCIYRRDAYLECNGLRIDLGPHCDIFLGMLIAVKYGTCFLNKEMTSFRLTPYSYSASSSLQESLKSYTLMATLMRFTYANLFPVGYAEKFELRGHLRLKIGSIMNQIRSQLLIMDTIVEKNNILDRTPLVFIKITSYLLIVLFLCYLSLRLKPQIFIVLKQMTLIKIKYLIGWIKCVWLKK